MTSKVIEFAENYKIIILCLPPHSTDLLQPLDVGVFGSLTQAYKLYLEALTRLGMGYAVDKVDFIKMYQKARVKVMTSANIKSAWTKSGLLPLNPAIVLEKLPSRNPRPNTPPELRLTSSDGVSSFALSFTPSNSAKVDVLIHRIAKHNNKDLQTFKKLAKACTSAIARSQCQESTDKTLLEVAEHLQCDLWVTSSTHWEQHCQSHLDVPETLPLRCDLLIFRQAPVYAGCCPFCFGK